MAHSRYLVLRAMRPYLKWGGRWTCCPRSIEAAPETILAFQGEQVAEEIGSSGSESAAHPNTMAASSPSSPHLSCSGSNESEDELAAGLPALAQEKARHMIEGQRHPYRIPATVGVRGRVFACPRVPSLSQIALSEPDTAETEILLQIYTKSTLFAGNELDQRALHSYEAVHQSSSSSVLFTRYA